MRLLLAVGCVCLVTACGQNATLKGGGNPNNLAAAQSASCAHAICAAGVSLDATCDPCAGQVCSQDSYCCSTQWDSVCVGEVSSICGQTCGASCSGCVDSSGNCQPGTDPSACGSGGNACVACGSGQACQSGSCVSGPVDAGPALDAGQSQGKVGPNGGTVSNIYFAVIGDTRPANQDDVGNYPTAIIQQIYKEVAALTPAVEFVVGTGDYMYASTTGSSAQQQMQLYLTAASQFTNGPLFLAMGNHECTGFTAGNCAGTSTANFQAYQSGVLAPLGKSTPYYSVPLNAADGSWTAKVVIAACNAWDSTQQNWFQSAMAQPTTYTFVVRHEDSAATTTPPCASQMDAIMASSNYDLFITGHSHQFSHLSAKEVVVGNGGAPLSGSYNYGFTTVQQTSAGFLVTDYDYATGAAATSFTVP